MPEMRLYIKSRKIDLVQYTMPQHDHYCSAGYRAAGTLRSLNEEDREALKLVKSLGIKCRVIDLAEVRASEKLKAVILGFNKTPTLVIGDTKTQGIDNIRKQIQA